MTLLGVGNSPEVQQLLTERLGGSLTSLPGPPEIAVERHLETARVLRDEMRFSIFGFVVAAHYPAESETATEQYRVVYGLRTVGRGSQLATWQVQIAVDQSIPTLVPLFAGADWQEREQFDLVGVRFDGHPDLRRLMLAEDWKGHPLRKDYAIDTKVHPWR